MVSQTIRPRPYQADALEAVKEKLRTHQSTIAVMATGLGKTILFGMLADEMRRRGRVMILAHREELIDQAADKVGRVTGCHVDIEMADRRASQLVKAPIVMSSIQTQTAGRNGDRRMKQFDPAEFSLVVVDEFHHAAADTYRETLAHYTNNPNCKVLGVTATPRRTDQKALAVVCESVAFRMGLLQAIQEGWLCDIEQRFVRVEELDYAGVKVRLGDFQVGSLAEMMKLPRVVEAVSAATIQYAEQQKSLIFCVDVEHAELITRTLNEFQPEYAHIVTGETPSDERRRLIGAYRTGQYPCLVNCMIATEGFDVPDIRYVIMARPTKSALLYEQMLGRGTRSIADLDTARDAEERKARIAASDKPRMHVIDFVGNANRHEIITVIDVLGGNMKAEASVIAGEILDREGGGSVSETMRLADEELQARKKIRFAKAICTDQVISPFKHGNDPYAIFGIEYRAGEHVIEEWQREKLDKWRMPIPDTAEEAQDLIDEVRSRTQRRLCTFRQARLVTQWGYDGKNMPFDEAGRIITERLNK